MFTLNDIPLKNIKAHFSRSILLMLLVALQTICIFYTFFLVNQMKEELELSEKRFGADLIVYPYASLTKISKEKLLMQGTPVSYSLSRGVLKKLENCEHIKESSYQVYVEDKSGEKPVWIIGIEADKDFVIRPWLKDRKKSILRENEVYAGCNVVVENNQVRLFNHDFKLTSYLDSTGSALDSMVFVSMETLKNIVEIAREEGFSEYQRLNPLKVFSALLINTDGPEYVKGVTSWINLHVRKVIAVRSESTLLSSSSGIQTNLKLTLFISAVLYLILLAALFIAQYMTMKERKKELHVWYCLAASEKTLSSVMLKESFLLILWGFFLGFIVFMLYYLFKGLLLDLAVSTTILSFFAALFISLVTGILSSYISLKMTLKKINAQMLINI